MRTLTRRGAAVGAALVVAVSTAGAAWAWQISSRSGSATVKAAAITNLAVSAGTNPVTGLFPGGSADLSIKVTNPNAFPVTILSVNPQGTVTADSAHGGCTAALHGVATTSAFYIGGQLPAQRTVAAHGHLDLSITNAVTMAADSADACIGSTFKIPLYVLGTTP
jgi:hypothetical protein